MNEFRKRILDHAEEHGFLINLSKGFEPFVQDMLHLGFCPCTNRKHCPCPESIDEVRNDGHCKCRLFWLNYDTFRKTLTAKGRWYNTVACL